jgi:ISXO2-like transposase domain/Transposase zinc-ribbon domain
MPMNRVQFQKGMSLGEFMRSYGTEEACERELESQRWQEGFVCPSCGSREFSNFRRGRLLYRHCCDCRHQASLIAGTVMASSKLGLRVWFRAAYVLSQAKNNVSALELMRHLGVCYQTAWSLKHKLMEAMWVRESSRTLGGTVQVDEAFLGGQAAGRDSLGRKGKVALLAAVSAAPDGRAAKVCLSLQPATAENVVVFCLNTLEPGSKVVSDGAPSFNYAKWNQMAEHQAIVTAGGKQACEIPQLNAVNTVLGNLKTGIAGTYHAFKFAKYGYRYLAEYQYRFNRGSTSACSCNASLEPPWPANPCQCPRFPWLRIVANQVTL